MSQVITAKTGILGVMGWPVGHSLSPVMHNAALRHLGLAVVYVAFPSPPETAEQAIHALRSLGILGVNCTIPHKETAFRTVDWRSPEAEATGAVNTIRVTPDRLEGYNTDVAGFLAPLDALGVSLSNAKAAVLGSGGSARGVVYALASRGADVNLFARNQAAAQSLLIDLQPHLIQQPTYAGELSEFPRGGERFQLIVNCTPMGMAGAQEGSNPIDGYSPSPEQVCYDLVYRPMETPFLAAGRIAGCATLNGLEMLIHQGAEALRIWLGVEPPIEVMRQAALDELLKG